MKSIETEILIPFHDVDSMRKVWHGHYAKYIEVARCELLESFNYCYEEMEASGYAWPIVDMRIKYIRPLMFKQQVIVSATLVEWEHRLKIAYQIKDAKSGTVLTKAHTTQMAIHVESEETCFESPLVLFERLGISAT